jgi:hypothetical protein
MTQPLYESEFELEDELEGEHGEFESEGELEFEDEGELEFEGEGELEFEGEGELNPIRKIYADAMMEHLGELAAEAESEDEAAEHFLPLIGMAASKLLPVVARAAGPLVRKALPRVARTVTKLAPGLTRGIGQMARSLHRNPITRPLLKAVPSIARRTVGTIARQAARGRQITPKMAVRTLAQQTRHVLANPRRRAHVLRLHNSMDRRFHRHWGRGIARPHVGAAGGATITGAARGAAPAFSTAGVRYVAGPGGTRVPVSGGPAAGVSRVAGLTGHVCPPCPACGTSVAQAPALAPAYCRCCGQIVR